jgi:hypothetical protein
MSKAYTGGCPCGAIGFEIAGEPDFSNHCQCRDRHYMNMSGTGHGSYLTFEREGAECSGDAKLWDLKSDSAM